MVSTKRVEIATAGIVGPVKFGAVNEIPDDLMISTEY
jgi:hypothetical protein